MSHPFNLSEGASSTDQVSDPVVPSLLHLGVHPDPTSDTPPQTQWMSHLPVRQGANAKQPRSIQLGHQSGEGSEGGVL